MGKQNIQAKEVYSASNFKRKTDIAREVKPITRRNQTFCAFGEPRHCANDGNPFKVSCLDLANTKQNLFRVKTDHFYFNLVEKAVPYSQSSTKKILKVQNAELFKAKILFDKYLCQTPHNLAKCSLHDRRFMSQAGRTRYFARSARPGEEKNKDLFFSSPRLALRAKYRVLLFGS